MPNVISAWHFIIGCIGPYGGFGLESQGNVVLAGGLSNGTVNLYCDGDAAARVATTMDLSAEEQRVNLQTAGNSGRDFEIEVIFDSVDGGKRFISPILVELNEEDLRE